MAALRWRAKLGVETPVSRQLCAFALPALLGRSAACHAQSAKPSSQVGPVQSNGICLLDLPAQFHWKPGALTKLVVVLPHVHTCPAPVSDPGGLRSWTRAPGGVVGPVKASEAVWEGLTVDRGRWVQLEYAQPIIPNRCNRQSMAP